MLLGAPAAALLGLVPAAPPGVTAASAVAPVPVALVPAVGDVAERSERAERAARSRSVGPLPSAPAAAAEPVRARRPHRHRRRTRSRGARTCRAGGTPTAGCPPRRCAGCPATTGTCCAPDAAHAFARLDEAYSAHFGERLCVTDSYRSLSGQQALARRKPGLAARPGTSEHGYGLAVDLACGVEGYRTAQHRWLVAHAAGYGWAQPSWARDGGRREEPWHWEFTG